jgi:Holliday junction resolvase-like predicted endonuclease
MGIAKFLKSGRITLNGIENIIEIENCSTSLPYKEISPSDWGQIYEKYVGQILENEGYTVQYNGLELGFLDRGIDLVAENEHCINFIQCKFTKDKIGKSKIDWILYKASSKLHEQHKSSGKELKFTLVVNKIDINFSKRIPKNFRLAFTETSNIKYPWLQYFLDHNHVQDKVKLECREIQMNNNYSQQGV